MKYKFQFDGNNDRKRLAGYHAVDDKGEKLGKATLWPIWVTKTDFPDGLPSGFEIEMKPIFTNGKAPAKPKAAAKAKAPKKPAKTDDKAAEKTA